MTKDNAVAVRGDYEAITSPQALTDRLDTSKFFDPSHLADKLSPVDQYIRNTNAVNLVWLREQEISPELASIALLGYMSAVESYMRALIRALINVDATCKEIVEAKSISFAAALHHRKEILPEALLEDISFAGPENIKKTISAFLGLPSQFPSMEAFFAEFEKISQLRHCCTHRFGKLGTKNAMALGLSAHTQFLEKPLKLSKKDLETAADILRNFVKNLNNIIFRGILDRSVIGGKTTGTPINITKIDWTWSYDADKATFSKYYKIFATTSDALPSPKKAELYERFASVFRPKPIQRKPVIPSAVLTGTSDKQAGDGETTAPMPPQVEPAKPPFVT